MKTANPISSTVANQEATIGWSFIRACKKNYMAVADKYARIIYELAQPEQLLKWQTFLFKVTRLVMLPSLTEFLEDPRIKLNQRLDLFAGLGTVEQRGFLEYLFKRKHLYFLPNIMVSYQRYFLKHYNIRLAKVFSAVCLSEEQLKHLQQKLKVKYQTEVIIQNYLDPGVKGGFLIHLGDTVLDYSLRGVLRRLKHKLLENE